MAPAPAYLTNSNHYYLVPIPPLTAGDHKLVRVHKMFILPQYLLEGLDFMSNANLAFLTNLSVRGWKFMGFSTSEIPSMLLKAPSGGNYCEIPFSGKVKFTKAVLTMYD